MPSSTWLPRSQWDALSPLRELSCQHASSNGLRAYRAGTSSSTIAPRGSQPPLSATPRDSPSSPVPLPPVWRSVGTESARKRRSALYARPSVLDSRADRSLPSPSLPVNLANVQGTTPAGSPQGECRAARSCRALGTGSCPAASSSAGPEVEHPRALRNGEPDASTRAQTPSREASHPTRTTEALRIRDYDAQAASTRARACATEDPRAALTSRTSCACKTASEDAPTSARTSLRAGASRDTDREERTRVSTSNLPPRASPLSSRYAPSPPPSHSARSPPLDPPSSFERDRRLPPPSRSHLPSLARFAAVPAAFDPPSTLPPAALTPSSACSSPLLTDAPPSDSPARPRVCSAVLPALPPPSLSNGTRADPPRSTSPAPSRLRSRERFAILPAALTLPSRTRFAAVPAALTPPSHDPRVPFALAPPSLDDDSTAHGSAPVNGPQDAYRAVRHRALGTDSHPAVTTARSELDQPCVLRGGEPDASTRRRDGPHSMGTADMQRNCDASTRASTNANKSRTAHTDRTSRACKAASQDASTRTFRSRLEYSPAELTNTARSNPPIARSPRPERGCSPPLPRTNGARAAAPSPAADLHPRQLAPTSSSRSQPGHEGVRSLRRAPRSPQATDDAKNDRRAHVQQDDDATCEEWAHTYAQCDILPARPLSQGSRARAIVHAHHERGTQAAEPAARAHQVQYSTERRPIAAGVSCRSALPHASAPGALPSSLDAPTLREHENSRLSHTSDVSCVLVHSASPPSPMLDLHPRSSTLRPTNCEVVRLFRTPRSQTETPTDATNEDWHARAHTQRDDRRGSCDAPYEEPPARTLSPRSLVRAHHKRQMQAAEQLDERAQAYRRAYEFAQQESMPARAASPSPELTMRSLALDASEIGRPAGGSEVVRFRAPRSHPAVPNMRRECSTCSTSLDAPAPPSPEHDICAPVTSTDEPLVPSVEASGGLFTAAPRSSALCAPTSSAVFSPSALHDRSSILLPTCSSKSSPPHSPPSRDCASPPSVHLSLPDLASGSSPSALAPQRETLAQFWRSFLQKP